MGGSGAAEPGALSVLVDRTALQGRGRGILFRNAQVVTTQDVNLMAHHGRGLIAAALTADRAFALGLTPMPDIRRKENAPRYMTSVEASACTETGISAAERALTLRVLGSPVAAPGDLVAPGHIMPAIVIDSEAAGAGLETISFHHAARYNAAIATAWCDILDEDGNVGDSDYCARLAERLSLPLLVRRGNAAIAAALLEQSAREPDIKVGATGLDLGQFA